MKSTIFIPLVLTAIAVCAEEVNTNGSSSFPDAPKSETLVSIPELDFYEFLQLQRYLTYSFS